MALSLQRVETSTQQFTVTGYVNAMWRANDDWCPDFEMQTKNAAVYSTAAGTNEGGTMSVKQQLEEEQGKDGRQHVRESVAEGESRYYITDFDLTCVSPLSRESTLFSHPRRTCCRSVVQPRVGRVAVQHS